MANATPSGAGLKRCRMWEEKGFYVGMGQKQGCRSYQEDGYMAIPHFNDLLPSRVDKSIRRSFFAIYDGHGGIECMDFVRDAMHHALAKAYVESSSPEDAIVKAFGQVETDWFEKIASEGPPRPYGFEKARRPNTSGTTATVCLVEWSETECKVYCGNVGDSRAVIYKSTKETVPLTDDHKPARQSEIMRIESVGARAERRTYERRPFLCFKARAIPYGPHRVQPGGLAIARSIGDAACKLPELGAIPGAVIAEPEVQVGNLDGDSQFLVLATDGVWDTFPESSKMRANVFEAFATQHDEFAHGFSKPPQGKSINEQLVRVVAQQVVNCALHKSKTPSAHDNTSALIVLFPYAFGKRLNLEVEGNAKKR